MPAKNKFYSLFSATAVFIGLLLVFSCEKDKQYQDDSYVEEDFAANDFVHKAKAPQSEPDAEKSEIRYNQDLDSGVIVSPPNKEISTKLLEPAESQPFTITVVSGDALLDTKLEPVSKQIQIERYDNKTSPIAVSVPALENARNTNSYLISSDDSFKVGAITFDGADKVLSLFDTKRIGDKFQLEISSSGLYQVFKWPLKGEEIEGVSLRDINDPDNPGNYLIQIVLTENEDIISPEESISLDESEQSEEIEEEKAPAEDNEKSVAEILEETPPEELWEEDEFLSENDEEIAISLSDAENNQNSEPIISNDKEPSPPEPSDIWERIQSLTYDSEFMLNAYRQVSPAVLKESTWYGEISSFQIPKILRAQEAEESSYVSEVIIGFSKVECFYANSINKPKVFNWIGCSDESLSPSQSLKSSQVTVRISENQHAGNLTIQVSVFDLMALGGLLAFEASHEPGSGFASQKQAIEDLQQQIASENTAHLEASLALENSLDQLNSEETQRSADLKALQDQETKAHLEETGNEFPSNKLLKKQLKERNQLAKEFTKARKKLAKTKNQLDIKHNKSIQKLERKIEKVVDQISRKENKISVLKDEITSAQDQYSQDIAELLATRNKSIELLESNWIETEPSLIESIQKAQQALDDHLLTPRGNDKEERNQWKIQKRELNKSLKEAEKSHRTIKRSYEKNKDKQERIYNRGLDNSERKLRRTIENKANKIQTIRGPLESASPSGSSAEPIN